MERIPDNEWTPEDGIHPHDLEWRAERRDRLVDVRDADDEVTVRADARRLVRANGVVAPGHARAGEEAGSSDGEAGSHG